MLKPSVDGFSGGVAGVGSVEIGHTVSRGMPSHPHRWHHWSGSTTLACQDGTTRLEPLAENLESEIIEAAEVVRSGAAKVAARTQAVRVSLQNGCRAVYM